MARKDAVERDRCAADTALTAVVFKKLSGKSMSAVGLHMYTYLQIYIILQYYDAQILL